MRKPLVSPNRAYIRYRSAANNAASSPPVPARILQQHGLAVVRILRQQAQLEVRDRSLQPGLQLVELGPRHLLHLRIGLGQQLPGALDLRLQLTHGVPPVDDVADVRVLLGHLAVLGHVGRHVGVHQHGVERLQAELEGVQVLEHGGLGVRVETKKPPGGGGSCTETGRSRVRSETGGPGL